MNEQITTARLHLRMIEIADLDDLSRIFADPDVVRYVGHGQPASREESETALHSMIRHWELHDYGRWAVTDKETKRFIGVGGLRSLFGTPELVYHLSTEYWGRGLGTELAQSILSFGFRMRVFERIVAITKPGNLRSQKVMQKVGMTFEKNETYYGMEVVQYSITIEEYARLTASPQWA